MKKKLTVFICVLITITFLTVISDYGSSLPPPLVKFRSFDNFHDSLLLSMTNRSGSLGSVAIVSDVNLNRYIRSNNQRIAELERIAESERVANIERLESLQKRSCISCQNSIASAYDRDELIKDSTSVSYYFVPSWLPTDYTLSIIATIDTINAGVSYLYNTSDYNFARNTEVIIIEGDTIDFRWSYGENTEFIFNRVINVGSDFKHADGVEGLFYKDSGDRRTYSWIQHGQLFYLEIPLWTIDGIDGRINEFAINELIMNSSIKVDLVEGEHFIPPYSVEIDETEAELEIGESIELIAVVTPYNATISAVYWNSSDNRVATVDQNGVVTRVGPGSAIITATTVANGLTASFELVRTIID